MKLHFPISEIRTGIEELKTAKTKPKKWDWEAEKEVVTDPGFMLVGDHGVYLMPNTTDGKINSNRKKETPEDTRFFVIYAKECDPTKLDFDTWWENKRASFGGDDGAEYISLKEIERILAAAANDNAKNLVIDIRSDQFMISYA